MTLLLHWDENAYREETAALKSLPQTSALVIGSDFSDFRSTVAQLVEARRRGQVAALYPILAEPLEAILEQIGTAIAQQGDAGSKFVQLLALRDGRLQVNNKPLGEFVQYPADAVRAAVLAVKLADVLLCFTAAERERWSTLAGRAIRRFAMLPAPRVHEPCNTGGLTVYAPEKPRAHLDLVALALADRRIGAQYVTQETAKAVSVCETVIVPSMYRPARVLALAAAGHRVVAPIDADGRCVTYRPADPFSLAAAVDAAQTSALGDAFTVDPSNAAESMSRAGTPIEDGPLASVIVRTFDRPALLKRALRSIVAQTYRSVEIVVINNGGEDVESLAAAACAGRAFTYVTLPQRAHISAASNAGARAASGRYIGYLDDDDLLYPDHVARCVEALERTGADLAYTNCLAEYAQIAGEEKRLLGFQMFRDNDFVTADIYTDNLATIHSIMHRADVFERFGYFDESLPVTDDWEMWLRVSRGGRFVHVDRVTCEYSWRLDPQRGNMTLDRQHDFVECYGKITSRYASDVVSLPHIRARQEQTKAAQQTRLDRLAQLGSKTAQALIVEMAQTAVPAGVPHDPFA